MRPRRILRSAAIIGCIAIFVSVVILGCDPPEQAATKTAFGDTDGDGLSDTDETMVYGTSPILADTDGDGLSDYEEIVQHSFDPASDPLRFNPRIADMPLMNVNIHDPPLVSLRLTATDGETWSWETSQTIETDFTWAVSTTEEETFANTVGASDTINKEVAVQFQDNPMIVDRDAGAEDGGDGGARKERQLSVFEDRGGPDQVTMTAGASSTIDWSNTQSVTISFTAAQTRELRQALTYAQSYALTHEISASGAILEVLVTITNRGNLSFKVGNMVLASSFITGDGLEIPVGNLEINTLLSAFNSYSIAPGGWQGPVNFSRDFLTLEQFEMLASDITGLKINIGVYDLIDASGKPFVFDAPAIMSRTATLDVDFGGQRPHERYLVATNLDPARPGVSLRRALEDILRMPFETDPERGLTSVRNVSTVDPGHWTVELRHMDRGEVVTTAYPPPYELADILLRSGDVVHLAWSVP